MRNRKADQDRADCQWCARHAADGSWHPEQTYLFRAVDGTELDLECPAGHAPERLRRAGKTYARAYTATQDVTKYRDQAAGGQKDFDEGTRIQEAFFDEPNETNHYDEKKGRHLSDREMVKAGKAKTVDMKNWF